MILPRCFYELEVGVFYCEVYCFYLASEPHLGIKTPRSLGLFISTLSVCLLRILRSESRNVACAGKTFSLLLAPCNFFVVKYFLIRLEKIYLYSST